MSRRKTDSNESEKREHPVETACRLRGRTAADLCEELGISAIEMNVYTSGLRKAPEELLRRISRILCVDEVFLQGHAKTVSFWDGGETAICAVVLTCREARGTFMIVQKPAGDFLSAVQVHSRLLLAPCTEAVRSSAEIAADAWTDELGRPASL